MSVWNLLAKPLRQRGNCPALRVGDASWSYAELDAHSDRLGCALQEAGMGPGDRLAFLLPNSVELIACYLACFRTGIIAVPINYRYRARQIDYVLEDSGSRHLIAHAERVVEICEQTAWGARNQADSAGTCLTVVGDAMGHSSLAELCPSASTPGRFPVLGEADPLYIIYTSGTTAQPRGVLQTHGSIVRMVQGQQTVVPLSPEDACLPVPPISQSITLTTLVLPTWQAGGLVELPRGPTVDAFFEAMGRNEKKTFVEMGPAMLHQIVHDPRARQCPWSALRLCMVGGDVAPPSLREAFRDISGVELTEIFGMTETGRFAMNPLFGAKRTGSIGRPFPGVRIRVADEQGKDCQIGDIGEMIVLSPWRMAGYWNDPQATQRVLTDGWMRTGDLARYDVDGYLWFEGRRKHIISRGGPKVSPRAVESAFREHPAVHDVAVIGIPRPGCDRIVAFVVLSSEAEPRPSVRELAAFLDLRLARYMVPDRIDLVHELPRNAAGKVAYDRLPRDGD